MDKFIEYIKEHLLESVEDAIYFGRITEKEILERIKKAKEDKKRNII